MILEKEAIWTISCLCLKSGIGTYGTAALQIHHFRPLVTVRPSDIIMGAVWYHSTDTTVVLNSLRHEYSQGIVIYRDLCKELLQSHTFHLDMSAVRTFRRFSDNSTTRVE
jgi:hypothetical protein